MKILKKRVGMRILIVDDDYLSRSALRELLSQYGECDAVPNGNIALEMFKEAHHEYVPYSLITMDIEMPRMSGQDVVSHIRAIEVEKGIKHDDSVKILMVSAMVDMKNIARSYVEGCNAYCTKPVSEESLQKALKDLELL